MKMNQRKKVTIPYQFIESKLVPQAWVNYNPLDTWRILRDTNIAKSFERVSQSSEKIIGHNLSRVCQYLSTQVFIP